VVPHFVWGAGIREGRSSKLAVGSDADVPRGTRGARAGSRAGAGPVAHQKCLPLLMARPGDQYQQFLNGDLVQPGIRPTQNFKESHQTPKTICS